MAKTVELPLGEPIYSTYHHLATCGSAACNDPSVKNWYLNEVMIPVCNVKFLEGEYTSPQLNMIGATHHQCPCMEKHPVNASFLKGCEAKVIKNMLDKGYYVAFSHVDDYYVKGKSWYKERHFLHDGMIFGYSDEDSTFYVRAYNSDWRYKEFKTPQRSYMRGRAAGMAQADYGYVCAIRLNGKQISFDPMRVLRGIEEYLTISERKSPQTGEKQVCGIRTLDMMAKYLEKMIDGTIPYEKLDRRVFRLVWEHKKLMLERLQKAEEVLRIGSEISGSYAKLVKEAESIHMLYVAHRLKRRDALLEIMKRKLEWLKTEEEKLLSEFAGKMKGAIANGALEEYKKKNA